MRTLLRQKLLFRREAVLPLNVFNAQDNFRVNFLLWGFPCLPFCPKLDLIALLFLLALFVFLHFFELPLKLRRIDCKIFIDLLSSDLRLLESNNAGRIELAYFDDVFVVEFGVTGLITQQIADTALELFSGVQRIA